MSAEGHEALNGTDATKEHLDGPHVDASDSTPPKEAITPIGEEDTKASMAPVPTEPENVAEEIDSTETQVIVPVRTRRKHQNEGTSRHRQTTTDTRQRSLELARRKS